MSASVSGGGFPVMSVVLARFNACSAAAFSMPGADGCSVGFSAFAGGLGLPLAFF